MNFTIFLCLLPVPVARSTGCNVIFLVLCIWFPTSPSEVCMIGVQGVRWMYTGVCTLYRVYMLGLTLEWIKKQGGVEAMDMHNKSKCRIVYDIVENSNGFY